MTIFLIVDRRPGRRPRLLMFAVLDAFLIGLLSAYFLARPGWMGASRVAHPLLSTVLVACVGFAFAWVLLAALGSIIRRKRDRE